MTASSIDPRPLAARMRPRNLDAYVGQRHLLGKTGPLRAMVQGGQLHSMILWGPPGSGKTTLAQLLAHAVGQHFQVLSAVNSGVREIRAAVTSAESARSLGQGTVLFIDEIHRFNKSQQDALLPHVEEGVMTLIGATTENPSFALVNALLSRARVYVLKALTDEDLDTILDHALADQVLGLGKLVIRIPPEVRKGLLTAADGDARRVLNLLDLAVQLAPVQEGQVRISAETIAAAAGQSWRRFDKGGEAFYDEISAFHKSLRGSDPDAALYWLARMLDGGADPLYLARRLVRMASEDIGLADPRALDMALAAKEAYAFLGSPEGELALAQATVYLASSPKSNRVYNAWNAVRTAVRAGGSAEVPLHLRNAPTALLKALDYGKAYQYDHDYPDAIAPEQHYLPPGLRQTHFYDPSDHGLEARIQERLRWISAHRQSAGEKTPHA
ncbi:replication-associated recombination protein A [Acidithiobacillus ferrianus]|uniref:Replication-associated recombination protein A n=2 Tax=Acidithiobacillus ferrianus TaxID=2678518 RepID=A0A845UPT6_9PROT|nr:replication-associated recombination protein A [Acidithiobacillus ferrianus]NDU43548.1 AAA family ATPase [Acidithiobacillus ferrianus]